MAKILVPLATGFEEIEAVTIIDVNRRAGNEVIVASLDENIEVLGANKITLKADLTLKTLQTNDIDMIVLPGGAVGTENLSKDENVQNILKEFKKEEKMIGAICAAPFALYTAGVLNENFTCYPSFEKDIPNKYHEDKSVVIDGKVITSRGPGTAMSFALEIVEILNGKEKATALKNGMLIN